MHKVFKASIVSHSIFVKRSDLRLRSNRLAPMGYLALLVLVVSMLLTGSSEAMAPRPLTGLDHIQKQTSLPLIDVQQLRDQRRHRRGFNPLRAISRVLRRDQRARTNQRRVQERAQRPQRTTTNRSRRQRPNGNGAAAAATPRVIKDPNAAKILVVGDAIAEGVASGLSREFERDPMIDVVNRVNARSGLVRNDFFDWATNLPVYLDNEKPHLVVVLFGHNDRQNFINAGSQIAFRSQAWENVYSSRIATLVRLVRERRLPVVWVGLGPAADSSISNDHMYMNHIYEDVAVVNGGAFVDIWQPFSGESGDYISVGPDKNGQSVSLRAADGLLYTNAGYDKIAFFVARPIREFLGRMGVLLGDRLLGATGEVFSLTAPVAAAGEQLAGEELITERERTAGRQSQEATVAYPQLQLSLANVGAGDGRQSPLLLAAALIERGDLPTVEGRVDVIRLPVGVSVNQAERLSLDPNQQEGDATATPVYLSPFAIMPRAPTAGFDPNALSSPAVSTSPPRQNLGPRASTTPNSRSTGSSRSSSSPSFAPGLPGVRLQ